MKEHIPKRHLDFENPIKTNKQFDNTVNRIYGQIVNSATNPTSGAWGTGKNPANGIPRVGRKTQMLEREIEAQVRYELRQEKEQQEVIRSQRFFNSTSRDAFTAKDLTENVVGKKVMRT